MIEDYEHYLAPPPERKSWVQRLLAPFRSNRAAAIPTSAYLRDDLGLSDQPVRRSRD